MVDAAQRGTQISRERRQTRGSRETDIPTLQDGGGIVNCASQRLQMYSSGLLIGSSVITFCNFIPCFAPQSKQLRAATARFFNIGCPVRDKQRQWRG